MSIDADRLEAACGDLSRDAGITIKTVLEPLGGPGALVKPAIYAGPSFQEDWRWWGEPPQKTRAIVIDNTPSQANRLEAALERLRASLGLPEVLLDLAGIAGLPPHLPQRLSGFQFPHRHADAYLRDAMLDQAKFQDTPVGRQVLNATADNPAALFGWFPQALLFGYWQSHLGKKRSQAKLARSWVSEIVGYEPASPDGDRTRQRGLKGDPLNLSMDEPVVYEERDLLDGWIVAENSQKTGGSKKKEALSEIGHGQVPFKSDKEALSGVSFRAIQQCSAVSFAGLRRVRCKNTESSGQGRALLVALGLVAHVAAFGGAFSLRSGCDLRQVQSEWTWLDSTSQDGLTPLNLDEAIALFRDCFERAKAVGLITEGGWGEDPLLLTPNASLASAISKSWPLAN